LLGARQRLFHRDAAGDSCPGAVATQPDVNHDGHDVHEIPFDPNIVAVVIVVVVELDRYFASAGAAGASM
jgi:hypothetical protein